jgi:hypothetical protein
MRTFFLTALTLVSCERSDVPSRQPGVDDSTSSTSTPPEETETETPDTTGDTDAPTETTTTETTPTEPQIVRFIALGDAGEANPDQFQNAAAMETVCAARGCDFALYLGDNFYDSGVDDEFDSMFQTHFEDPYANLDFPFYVVLGNHDYGAEGLGLEFWKAGYYINYEPFSTKWTFPSPYYAFEKAHVGFLALNTTEMFFGLGDIQQDWIDDRLDNLAPHIEWTIAFGHHPYVSNGQHGNAGRYEGIPDLGLGVVNDIPRGAYIEDIFDESLCGQVTVYISGHDHNRQFLEPACGTEFFVSGAGAKTTDLVHRDNNPTFWESDSAEGFLWVEIIDNEFTGAFYDLNGTLEYSQTFVF